jgi:hypothetical protein
MENLKTSGELIAKMIRATRQVLTEDELRRQRASFVFGAIDSDNNVTTDRVNEILAKHDGRKVA